MVHILAHSALVGVSILVGQGHHLADRFQWSLRAFHEDRLRLNARAASRAFKPSDETGTVGSSLASVLKIVPGPLRTRVMLFTE